MKARLKKSSESLADHVLDEIANLRAVFTQIIASYCKRIQSELREIEGVVGSIPQEQQSLYVADMRELLNLLRNLQVKPEKGRRKDLKKIDSLVGDLNLIVENLRIRLTAQVIAQNPRKPTAKKIAKTTETC